MRLAVYTTIYPGVQKYLADWYRSLLSQTDLDFELWIGLDTWSGAAVEDFLETEVQANWVAAPAGASPGEVRQLALSRLVESYDGVVLVDSDDVLLPTRVEAARLQLAESDLAGCALALIDEQGTDLALTFTLPMQVTADSVMPRNNVFGFSNSAYRTDLLQRCLPIPAEAVAVDWCLATRAWLLGARLAFDPTPRMSYRQHPRNTARVRSPFGPGQIISDTNLVRTHFGLLQSHSIPGCLSDRQKTLKKITDDVESFYEQIVLRPQHLDSYVRELNALEVTTLWWACVANPALADMWTEQRVSA
jgi:hypothetical protein